MAHLFLGHTTFWKNLNNKFKCLSVKPMEKVHVDFQFTSMRLSSGPLSSTSSQSVQSNPDCYQFFPTDLCTFVYSKLLLFPRFSIVMESVLPCLDQCLIFHFSGVLS